VKTLTMPAPLDNRLFHSRQVIENYQNAVADFLQQQQQAEYNCKSAKRSKHKTRRQQYDDQTN